MKTLFALAYPIVHEVGLSSALDLMGIKRSGRAHRGADDALDAARILGRLIRALQENG